ncbi:hypothetical protein [Clostridium sp. LP20]|uniref:hypothetical protein n=1 Tax=Clostridium sp. LP20 TaxID=3418665 RepID=UPI003EE64CC7
MRNKSEKMQKFIDEQFEGNRKACARKLDISESTICRIIKGDNKAGGKLITKIIKYCDENEVDYKEYLYL